jgi:hypothetical protein
MGLHYIDAANYQHHFQILYSAHYTGERALVKLVSCLRWH